MHTTALQDTLLPEINREETRIAVENALEKYRIFLLREPIERLPKVTASYSLVPPSNTNAFHSTTEDAAIANADYESDRHDYLRKIQTAINRLGYWERAIIINKYCNDDNIFDYQVYSELHISEKKYYKIKWRAVYKLAFSLRLEIYDDED